MSDLKLFNLKSKKSLSSKKLSPLQVQEHIENNSQVLLGITLIASNYTVQKGNNDVIQTLGYDENFVISIIEYRIGKYGKLIHKGLMLLDYIKENISEFKILVNDKFGPQLISQMSFNPRLIIVGDDFVKYDEYAISQMNYQIDLIRYQFYSLNYIILEKNYQSKKSDHTLFKYRFKTAKEQSLYQVISQFILSLGDEVVEVGFSNVLSYRKIKYFMYLVFSENMECSILINNKYQNFIIKNEKDFDKIQDKIELSYDQN